MVFVWEQYDYGSAYEKYDVGSNVSSTFVDLHARSTILDLHVSSTLMDPNVRSTLLITKASLGIAFLNPPGGNFTENQRKPFPRSTMAFFECFRP